MLPITALYAGTLVLLFLGLSIRVITYRRRNLIGLGDAGDKSLLKRMRAQANCAEYAPVGILVLAICELQGAPAIAVHLLGGTLLLGRGLHAFGFSASPPVMMMRVTGMLLTLLMLAAGALGLIVHAIV
ncbi:MAPEG family protein [Roseobacteraceae bacterium S113]